VSTIAVPTVEDLSAIAGQVWASYLDPEGEHPLIPGGLTGAPSDVVASVSVSGGWSGHVVVSCSTTAAKQTAAAFLMMDAGDVSTDDVADVMGELANIVGGNVKSMLPSSSFVSLPQVVNGAEAGVRWPACHQVTELTGTWHGEPMSISVWQKDDQAEAAGR
jgi:chemotaxis protein CheX